VPKDVILTIFCYLGAFGLAKCREVCRSWKNLAFTKTLWDNLDLQKEVPSFTIKTFDGSDWKTHVDLERFKLSVDDEPALDKRVVIPFLVKRISTSVHRIARNTGITILTMPKGLTLNKLVELAQSPKEGKSVPLADIPYFISDEMRNLPVNQTYRLIITNNVFEKQNGRLSFEDQDKLILEIGCTIPRALEAATLIAATCMRSNEEQDRPYYGDPLLNHSGNYTRCSEHFRYGQTRYQLAVGFPESIYIDSVIIEEICDSESEYDDSGSEDGYDNKDSRERFDASKFVMLPEFYVNGMEKYCDGYNIFGIGGVWRF